MVVSDILICGEGSSGELSIGFSRKFEVFLMDKDPTSTSLIVRDFEKTRTWRGLTDWTVLKVIGGVADEPLTTNALLQAGTTFDPNLLDKLNGRETDGGAREIDVVLGDPHWVWIDLPGRMVVQSHQEYGEGFFQEEAGPYRPEHELAYIIMPPEWLLLSQEEKQDWLYECDCRTERFVLEPTTDTRKILFGEPVRRFMTEGLLLRRNDIMAATLQPQVDSLQYDIILDIHERWQLLPRTDLGGKSPREVLLESMNFVQEVVRCKLSIWQARSAEPRRRDYTSGELRTGRYGIDQNVLSFEMIREMLRIGVEAIVQFPDVVYEELEPLLAEAQADFWNQHPSGTAWLNRDIMAQERSRLPLPSKASPCIEITDREPLFGPRPTAEELQARHVANRSNIDCDCPICLMMEEDPMGFGLTFLMSNGTNLELDNRFAFSLEPDYEEWKRNNDEFEAQYQEHKRKEKLREAERGEAFELGSSQHAESEADLDSDRMFGGDSVWKSSYVDWDNGAAEKMTPELLSFKTAFPVSELIVCLNENGDPENARRLNRDFQFFRRSCSSSDLGKSLTAIEKFCEQLKAVTLKHLDLAPRLNELQRILKEKSLEWNTSATS